LNIPYPIDNNGNAKGQIFAMWTKELPLDEQPIPTGGYLVGPENKKQWWKFW
jgi:hypothetical protein